jgi:hypothetical protein
MGGKLNQNTGEILSPSIDTRREIAFDPWQLATLLEQMAQKATSEARISLKPTTPVVRMTMTIADAVKLAAILKSVPRIN